MTARVIGTLLCAMLPAIPCYSTEKPYPDPFFENEQLLMVIKPRTAEQMAAFYEARGFPQAAIDIITNTCFVTVHIENRSQQVIWLETANWRLSSNGQAVNILGAGYWNEQWDTIKLMQANRSTFHWTQLPPVVDLQSDEPVAGNIVVPGGISSFHIEANFKTGKDKRGESMQKTFEDVGCPQHASLP
jgi:hypothetical protein